MIYGKVHRFLLRTVASKGVVTMEEAEGLVKSQNDNTDISVQDIVTEINSEIGGLKQTIKITTDEMTNESILIFLSLGFDDATKAQNVFSPNELDYFRLLIEEIMSTDVRQISSINALNLVHKMKGSFSKLDVEKVLKTWCRMRYLDKSGHNYALGVRAIHEFESYFRQNMPDIIEECSLCKKFVFRGYNCPSCSEAVHTRCLEHYLEKVQKWPCCQLAYDAAQLEAMGQESSSRQSARLTARESVAYDTTMGRALESTQEMTQETSAEDVDLTQTIAVSQSVTRKRKHQK